MQSECPGFDSHPNPVSLLLCFHREFSVTDNTANAAFAAGYTQLMLLARVLIVAMLFVCITVACILYYSTYLFFCCCMYVPATCCTSTNSALHLQQNGLHATPLLTPKQGKKGAGRPPPQSQNCSVSGECFSSRTLLMQNTNVVELAGFVASLYAFILNNTNQPGLSRSC